MKNLSLIFIAFLLIQFTSLAQEGWFWQNPFPTGSNLYSVDFVNEFIGIVVGSEGGHFKN